MSPVHTDVRRKTRGTVLLYERRIFTFHVIASCAYTFPMHCSRRLLPFVIILSACGQSGAPPESSATVATASIAVMTSVASVDTIPVPVATSTDKPAIKRPTVRRPERIEAAPARNIDTVVVYTLAPTYTIDGNRYVEENIATQPMEENLADTEDDYGCL